MRYKLVSMALAMCVMAGLLSGCGGDSGQPSQAAPTEAAQADNNNADEPASEAEATGDGEKIKIVEWSQGEKVMVAKQEVAAEYFPNIEYEYVLVNNGDYVTKLQTALATGTDVPDIITVEIGNRGAVFALDILENLEADPYNYDRSKLFDAVIPALVNERDELVALDNQFCPSGFAYNRELVNEYFGVSEPDDVYQLVKDWDTFIATGLELKEKSGGTVNMMSGMYDLLEILAGQEIRDYIDGDVVDVTGRYAAAIEKACAIRDAGVPLASNEKNSTSWNAAYTDGSVLFFNHASWSTNSCIVSNDPEQNTMGQWGFCMAPGGGWMNGGTSIGIYKDSPHKQEVWEFIQFFQGSVEGYEYIYDRVGWIPSFTEFFEGDDAPINKDFMYQDWFGGQNYCKYIYGNVSVGIAPYEQQTPHTTLVNNCFRDMSLQFLINPSLTAEEGLEYLKEKISIEDPTLTVQ